MSLLPAATAVLRRRPVLAVFLLACLARGVVLTYIAVRHDGYLFEDDQQYVILAGDRAAGDTAHWDAYTHFLYRSNATLVVPMSLLFRVFGEQAALGQVYVALFGAATAACVARLAMELGSRGAAFGAGAAVALLPSQVLFSSLTLKDALVWSGLSALALVAAVLGRTRDARRFVFCVATTAVLLVLLSGLRQHTMVVAAWALAMTAWFGCAGRRLARVASATALAMFVPLLVGAGFAGTGLLRQAGDLQERRALGAQGAATAVVAPAPTVEAGTDPAAAAGLRSEAAEAAARAESMQEQLRALQAALAAASGGPEEAALRERLAALQPQVAGAQQEAVALAVRAEAQAREPAEGLGDAFGDSAGTQGNLAYLPRGLSVVLLQPYPWVATDNARLEMARLETLFWYPLLGLALVGLVGFRRRARILAFPLVVAGGVALMWALVEGNFGTAYRHRGELVWAVAVLAAGGVAVLRDRRKARRSVATASSTYPVAGPRPQQAAPVGSPSVDAP